jgi:nucleoside-diphosphate-sugar epimerase
VAETVLVTGGTGFIAGWCIVELLERGYDVRTTVRSPEKQNGVRAGIATATTGGDPGDRLGFAVADLTSDNGWDQAMAGCSHVLHVASPLGLDGRGDVDGDPDALIVPARDGALRVLGAAVAAGVRRVVMTSAANAASPSSYAEDGVTDETLWTDVSDPTLPAYRRSKTVAEQAAWTFMATASGPLELTTILPGAVFGPLLSRDTLGSAQVIRRLLRGDMPGTPRIGLEVVDVRDVADIHVRAMTAPAAAGERLLATGPFLWMADIARVLRTDLGPEARKVPTRNIPDFAVRLLARRRPELRAIMPALGRRNRHTTAKAQALLGWTARPAAETVVDCARSLIGLGAV